MMCGAGASFILSRYMFRSYVARKIQKNASSYPWIAKFYIIDQVLKEKPGESILIVLLLRIIYLPFGLLNYLLGCATSVSFCHYIAGTSVIIFRLSIIAFIGAHLYNIDIKQDAEKSASNNLFIII